MVEIKCPSCGTENWLENQSRCFQCDSVLRRCIDCRNYDRGRQRCHALDADVDLNEAQQPSLLSVSTNCPRFQCLGQAA